MLYSIVKVEQLPQKMIFKPENTADKTTTNTA